MQQAADAKLYPAVIEKGGFGYGVYFPDLSGCVSGGDTIADAVTNAHEALALHVAGMIEDSVQLPEPSALHELEAQPNEVEVAAILLIGVSIPSCRSVSIDVTLDDTLLRDIDRVTDDRSRFLADAARVELARRLAG